MKMQSSNQEAVAQSHVMEPGKDMVMTQPKTFLRPCACLLQTHDTGIMGAGPVKQVTTFFKTGAMLVKRAGPGALFVGIVPRLIQQVRGEHGSMCCAGARCKAPPWIQNTTVENAIVELAWLR